MMYGYGDGGPGWGWMVLMPLFWIALVGLVVWLVARTWSPRTSAPPSGDGPHRESPEEILERRFASGEIDAAAHAEALRHLAAHRTPPRA